LLHSLAEKQIDRFVAQLAIDGIASAAEISGCSEIELDALESKYAVRLPRAYRHFLRRLGHSSGKLFTHDHLAVSITHVTRLTQMLHESAAELAEEDDTQYGVELARVLPPGSLVIMGRLGEQFHAINCSSEEDAAVFHFDDSDFKTTPVTGSILEWMHIWRTEALEAIASGYFELVPGGTQP